MSGSRLPGFYKLSVAERRALVAERSGVDLRDAVRSARRRAASTSPRPTSWSRTCSAPTRLPFGLALNVQVNGTDRLVPMVVEEPSVIAAASNAARMVRHAGGFTAEMTEA